MYAKSGGCNSHLLSENFFRGNQIFLSRVKIVAARQRAFRRFTVIGIVLFAGHVGFRHAALSYNTSP
jgi:hypothetical protein